MTVEQFAALHPVHDCTPMLVAQLDKPGTTIYSQASAMRPGDKVFRWVVVFQSDCPLCCRVATIGSNAYVIGMN